MLDHLKSKVTIWREFEASNREDANKLLHSPLGPWFEGRADIYRHCADQLESLINMFEKEMEEKDGQSGTLE